MHTKLSWAPLPVLSFEGVAYAKPILSHVRIQFPQISQSAHFPDPSQVLLTAFMEVLFVCMCETICHIVTLQAVIIFDIDACFCKGDACADSSVANQILKNQQPKSPESTSVENFAQRAQSDQDGAEARLNPLSISRKPGCGPIVGMQQNAHLLHKVCRMFQ